MDPSSGQLTYLETVSSVPHDFAEVSHCAEILMHRSGRWLFVTTLSLVASGCTYSSWNDQLLISIGGLALLFLSRGCLAESGIFSLFES